jgi:signal transduction histidine kinase
MSVLGDATRLEQVIMNVLINAVRYTRRGGRTSIRTVGMGEEAEVELTDTGIGIDPAFLEQIFEPFRQETSSRQGPRRFTRQESACAAQ